MGGQSGDGYRCSEEKRQAAASAAPYHGATTAFEKRLGQATSMLELSEDWLSDHGHGV